MKYEVALSRVGHDQRIDRYIDVEASGPMKAELEAVRVWRDEANVGKVFVVSSRPANQGRTHSKAS